MARKKVLTKEMLRKRDITTAQPIKKPTQIRSAEGRPRGSLLPSTVRSPVGGGAVGKFGKGFGRASPPAKPRPVVGKVRQDLRKKVAESFKPKEAQVARPSSTMETKKKLTVSQRKIEQLFDKELFRKSSEFGKTGVGVVEIASPKAIGFVERDLTRGLGKLSGRTAGPQKTTSVQRAKAEMKKPMEKVERRALGGAAVVNRRELPPIEGSRRPPAERRLSRDRRRGARGRR